MALSTLVIPIRYFFKIKQRCLLNICFPLQTKSNSFYPNSSIEKKLLDVGLCEKSAKDIASNRAFVPSTECKVDATLDKLSKLQFGNDLLVKLINTHPLLLLVDSRMVDRICTKLLSTFTKNYVYNILLLSPEVLNEDWEVTSEKLNYLQEEMCVSNMDIVNYGILKHSLDHIKIRHEFLKRTGRYKKLNPKLSVSERLKINPSIQDVMNSNLEYFCAKVAGVTKLEFDVFQQLYVESDE